MLDFSCLFPFELASPSVPKADEIFNYSFKLDGYKNNSPQPSCLILVSVNEAIALPEKISKSMLCSLRKVLDPSTAEIDPAPAMVGKFIEKLRDGGLKVWTTFKWDGDDKAASAWMSTGFVNELVGQGWSVGIWRTDLWEPVCVPYLVGVESVVSRGEKWEV